MNKLILLLFSLSLNCSFLFSQEKEIDSIVVENSETNEFSQNQVIEKIQQANKREFKIEPMNPTKAGLYSAILPGLGQYYNKKYWKIPIAWAGIGTGVGISIWYNNQYKRYRKAYVAELNGLPHEFSDKDYITAEVLGNTQDQVKRQRDYAIAFTGLVYLLNIIDAVVDAHLYQGKKDPDLAIKPTVIFNQHAQTNATAGLSLNYNF